MRAILVLGMLFFAGCAAQMVTAPTASKYAPKGYVPKGMIKYLNQGADSIIADRREDAFKQMHEACKGDYEITKEGEGNGDAFVSRDTAGNMWGSTQKYWMIEFRCK